MNDDHIKAASVHQWSDRLGGMGKKRKGEGGFKLAGTKKETKTVQESEAKNRKHTKKNESEKENVNNERVCHVMAMTFSKMRV